MKNQDKKTNPHTTDQTGKKPGNPTFQNKPDYDTDRERGDYPKNKQNTGGIDDLDYPTNTIDEDLD